MISGLFSMPLEAVEQEKNDPVGFSSEFIRCQWQIWRDIHMTDSKKKSGWSDLKRRLADLDRTALLGLIQDLYAADRKNQLFLHARFALVEDVLGPYKAVISRWVCPDVMRNQDVSISKAKKAISDYRKAVGHPEGIAELMVFFGSCGMEDEGFFDALILMFGQALKVIAKLEPDQRKAFVDRLERVRHEARNWGWGVGDAMDDLMEEYGPA